MKKTILITGATDGIGLATARMLAQSGHHLLIHGRNAEKLASVADSLRPLSDDATVETYQADLSKLEEVQNLASVLLKDHNTLDVVINNAGVLKAPQSRTDDSLDVRFAVNTIAPWLLSQMLLPLLGPQSRIINLSSAAQAPVDMRALEGEIQISDDMDAYAQSKLAITSWSRHMANSLGADGPMVVAINPGSLLGSKMVKQGFGIDGKDIDIGANILVRAALSEEFESASGKYFDNDAGRFGSPHPDALDPMIANQVVDSMKSVLKSTLNWQPST